MIKQRNVVFRDILNSIVEKVSDSRDYSLLYSLRNFSNARVEQIEVPH